MDNKDLIEKVREALDKGTCLSVRFHGDGSGAQFHIMDPNGDHGTPCDRVIGLRMDDVIPLISGLVFFRKFRNN